MIPAQTHRIGRRPTPAARAWVAGAAALGAACGGLEAPPASDGAPRAIASIFPLGDLAARVGGDDVAVAVLVPPRADPSTFEPSPRQMQSFASARAFLLVGGGMDDWMVAVPGVEDVPVTRVNEGIPLREGGHGEGTGDPHTWLDPVLVRQHWLPRIVEALVAARPESRAAIERRGVALGDSLDALDAWMRDRLAPVRGRAFVATHSAWRYLAHRYGLDELGAIYDSPGREPSARELEALVTKARAADVRVVFTEPQLGETGARALAEQLGAEVELLDPIGGPGLEGRDGYLAMMRFNTEQLARALGGVR